MKKIIFSLLCIMMLCTSVTFAAETETVGGTITLTQFLGASREDVIMALDAIQSPVSLYEPVYTDGGDTLYVMDQISDKKHLEENWVKDMALKDAVNRLPERERMIIELRFFQGKTQMEVAGEIGMSQAQVSRLEKNALNSMKHYLE